MVTDSDIDRWLRSPAPLLPDGQKKKKKKKKSTTTTTTTTTTRTTRKKAAARGPVAVAGIGVLGIGNGQFV